MDDEKTQPWWEQVSNAIGQVDARNTTGDVIVAVVGVGAKNVAAGKNITQTVTEVLGPPTPDDKKQIEQGFAKLLDALAKLPVDEAAAERAKARIEILQEELAKPGDDGQTPARSSEWVTGCWKTCRQSARRLAASLPCRRSVAWSVKPARRR